MNLETKRIFIVGPGGVGKTTVGDVLADKIGYSFVDIDQEFCGWIELIGDYIKHHSYGDYCRVNSGLFEQLLNEFPTQTVFPMSSGFLVYEDSPELVEKHKRLLSENGVSILLLPSEDLEKSLRVTLPRQLSKGFLDTTEAHEAEVHRRRHPLYKECGDIRIFSTGSPDEVAGLIMEGLVAKGFQF